jgi:metal-responsive CopG/Arc/MetJ family transcriptional regulator
MLYRCGAKWLRNLYRSGKIHNMRVLLKLPDSLLKDVEILAYKTGRSRHEMILELCRRGLSAKEDCYANKQPQTPIGR